MIRKLKSILAVAFILSCPTVQAQEATLSLSDALSKSLADNYGLIISRAEVEVATINNHWGNAGGIPTIDFNASASNSLDILDESYTNSVYGNVAMNWVLFDGLKVHIRNDILENQQLLSEGTLGVMIESTVEDVIMAYYNVLLQQKELEVLKTVMELSEDRYRYELDRKALGGSVTYNVLQAQNLYLTDKANFMNQEVVVRTTVRDLNFLLGENPEKVWLFNEEFMADTADYQLNDLISKMKANNQTLKNQYTNLMLRESATSLERSDYSPSISLSTGITGRRQGTAVIGESSNFYNDLGLSSGVSLSYRIYDAGRRRRAVKVARINEEIARVEIEEMEHALTNELFNLYDYYQVRIALLRVAEENLAAAELNLSISEDKYRNGVINSFNYRDIQLIYLNAAVNRLRAVYNLIHSRTQLTRITGGFLGTAPGE